MAYLEHLFDMEARAVRQQIPIAGDSPLRYARVTAGLTIAQLADRTGIAHPDLSRIERGRRDSWPRFRRAAAAELGVPEDVLFPDVAVKP